MGALALPVRPAPSRRTGTPALRLVVPGDEAADDDLALTEPFSGPPRLTVVSPRPRRRVRAGRRPVSAAVRRRRTLWAVTVVCLLGLAFPLGGSGGSSHATGPAQSGTVAGSVYTVQPGDTLWSIATRLDPTGDPRPLVAKMEAEVGADVVVPGEHLTLP